MKKHIWYVETKLVVPVVLSVVAIDDQEAFARANDGAWHSVKPDWDHAETPLKVIGRIIKGPEINR